jgi:hypothetical protein
MRDEMVLDRLLGLLRMHWQHERAPAEAEAAGGTQPALHALQQALAHVAMQEPPHLQLYWEAAFPNWNTNWQWIGQSRYPSQCPTK